MSRRLWLLQAATEAARHQAAALLADFDPACVLTLGGPSRQDQPWRPLEKAHTTLGGEYDAVCLDLLETPFDADAFGAASGLVRDDGTLLLLAPPSWPGQSRYLARLLRLLRAEGCDAPPDCLNPPAPPAASARHDGCRSDDQRLAVAAVRHVVHGHRRRPLVLTADRGRGKSAAFGIAAAELLREQPRRILVTAPRRSATDALFIHAARHLPDAHHANGELHQPDGGVLRFMAPDALLHTPVEADLLLVDEAAAIPAALLEQLLQRYSRIAFATTVHGYEGTGRGFAVRFRATLDRLTPGWRELRLSQPIRWREGDRLERLTHRLLLLDCDPPVLAEPATDAEPESLDRQQLANEETTLSQLVGLLVLAHYRTRPSDLQRLLDEPDLSVHVTRQDGQIVAAAIVASEGGIDPATAHAIFAGQRRLHGHLGAQSLAAHAGLPDAATLRHARIRRIAVHPAVQRSGIGHRLLEHARQAAAAGGHDLLTASFGHEAGLLAFWLHVGLQPLHVGLTRETSSGAHALLVAQGLTPAGTRLVTTARQRLLERLPDLLADPLRDLDPALVATLLATLDPSDAPPAPDATLRQELGAVAHGQRGFEVSLTPLRRLLWHHLCSRPTTPLPDAARDALIARLLQHRPWSETAALLGVSGRKAAEQHLRAALRTLIPPSEPHTKS